MAELSYELAKLENCDELMGHLVRSFYSREPMSVGLHLTWQDHERWMGEGIKIWTACGASYICRDRANGNKIVGCIITHLVKRDEQTFAGFDLQGNEKLKIFFDVMSEMETRHNFFEVENVDKILELVVASVDEEYGGKGIATKLVQLSQEKGKELGAQLATGQATNFISQKLLRKQGYEMRYALDYGTYEFEGKKVFDTTVLGDSICVEVYTKRLQK